MWKFIKYSFNKAFEKNLLNLIIFFIALSFIGVLIISTVIFVFQKIGLLSESNFFVETLWQGFNLFFDQNAIFGLDGSKNNFFDFLLKFNITIFGILIFSSIIGIVTNYISGRIESLRSGKTKIEEENHIIFFNFSRRLIPLLTELCNAYVKEKQSFVIVSTEEPLMVMEKINNVIKIPKNITIVARKGYAWQKSLQDRINLKKAKQLIILKPDVGETYKTELDCDVEVGKSLASLLASKHWDINPCKVLAEFHDEKRGFLYLYYSRDIIVNKMKEQGNTWQDPDIISSSNLKNTLLAQCTNTPDLSEIYDNLFGYEGSEVYFIDPNNKKYSDILKKNQGKTIKDLNALCDNIIVIGFFQDDQRHNLAWNKLFVNSPIDFPLSDNFGIICVARDEDQIIDELNNIENQSKDVADISPNFKEDNKDTKISMFDYSKESNNLYLTKLINSIIDSNYYNNLKSLKVYRDKFDGSLTDKKFLPVPPDYKINKDEVNHPILGIIFHILKTEEKNRCGFQIYSINKQSSLSEKLSSGDVILNVASKVEAETLKGKSELELSYKSVPAGVQKRFKEKLVKLIDENNEIILIVKKSNSKDIEFIEIKKDQISKDQQQVHQSFKEIQSQRQEMINNLTNNITFEEKNLDDVTNEMSIGTVMEYEKDNCYIFFNETNQQIQKFRENPTEDHVMINNFVGFSNLRLSDGKMADHSMITEINGYRSKRILEDYKEKYFSPYIGNDVIEMNSIVSKYLAAGTFDIKNTKLIDLLFSRTHTIKAHTLVDKQLTATFCELEKYFQNKNETLIGIIDYEFDKDQRRKIKNISINPKQTENVKLDQGDRLITIANFNDLEMVNQSRYLHIL